MRLVARFYECVGDYLLERPLPQGSLLETESPGVVRFEMDAVLNQQLRWWVLSFGADIEVILPEALRSDIAQVVTRAAKRYR